MRIDLTPIKYKLESMTCPDHNQRPSVSLELGKIDITACCETFRSNLEGYANQEYVKAIDTAVVDVLDNAPSQFS